MNEKQVSQATQVIVLIISSLILIQFVNGLGASTYGGVYTTDVKIDFVGGNTTDTRVSGGFTPVGLNMTGSLYCWRLGIFGVSGCETGVVVPMNGSGSTCEDWRPKQDRVGLRRVAFVKTGVKQNALIIADDWNDD